MRKQKISYIQLPHGVVNKEKQVKLDLPRNYGAAQYLNSFLIYLTQIIQHFKIRYLIL